MRAYSLHKRALKMLSLHKRAFKMLSLLLFMASIAAAQHYESLASSFTVVFEFGGYQNSHISHFYRRPQYYCEDEHHCPLGRSNIICDHIPVDGWKCYGHFPMNLVIADSCIDCTNPRGDWIITDECSARFTLLAGTPQELTENNWRLFGQKVSLFWPYVIWIVFMIGLPLCASYQNDIIAFGCRSVTYFTVPNIEIRLAQIRALIPHSKQKRRSPKRGTAGKSDESRCVSCLSSKKNYLKTGCGHISFCSACLDNWNNGPCPTCRCNNGTWVRVYY